MAFLIISKAGAVMGVYEGETPTEALAAMHRDAGLAVVVGANGQLIFADDSDREMAGGPEDWFISDAEEEICEYLAELLAKDVDVDVTLRPMVWTYSQKGHSVLPCRVLIDSIRFGLGHSYADEGPNGEILHLHVDDRDGDRDMVERALEIASAHWHERLSRALRDRDRDTAAEMLGL